MLNLDTHIVVSLLNGDLSKLERDVILGASLSISDIVLWELAKLVQLRRLEMNLEDEAFSSFLHKVTVFPITLAIARKSSNLDFTSDPADEIIAATSIVENVPLLTRDRRILKSRVVPFVTSNQR